MMKAVATKSLGVHSTQSRHYASSSRIVHALSASSISSLFIQRKPSCPCGGGCPRCKAPISLQPKLKINEPNDQYEQEADRMAEQVMRMPKPTVQRKPT